MKQEKRPLIGVTASFYPNENNPPLSQQSVNRDYVLGVIKAGGMPVIIPAMWETELIEAYAEQLDGLMVPGGEDVDPKYYGQEPHEKLGRLSPIRDHTEITLIRKMAELGKPIFGICRGMQMINVAFGGDMIQDIPSAIENCLKHMGDMQYRSKPVHSVALTPGSRVHGIFGKDEIQVNTFHHQAIDRLAEGFEVTGRSPEGIAEAFENAQAKIWGVQWHPENMVEAYPEFLGLFQSFVNDCK